MITIPERSEGYTVQPSRAVMSEDTVRLRLPRLLKKHRLPDQFGTDLRSLGPIHICSCGSTLFNIMVQFENYEIVWWFLDGTCVSCGNLIRVPCPVDAPDK